MRVGPKLSLRPFLHRALQIFCKYSTKKEGVGPSPKSATVHRVEDPISMDCI